MSGRLDNSLYDPAEVRDACGVGFIARRDTRPGRDVMETAFRALKNLAHRGAVDADGKTGDGAGVLTAIPRGFYLKKAAESGVAVPDPDTFAIAMIFYPPDPQEREACRAIVRGTLRKYRVEEFWSREVPVDESVLGSKALANKPVIVQKFLKRPDWLSPDAFEKKLFLIRREIDAVATERSFANFYIPTMSARTIVHKGLFVGDEVRNFYTDLGDEDFVSPFAVFHQRFSTNTFPTWALAHPFRMLAHNGEINTLKGNRNWMTARTIAEQPRAWIPEQHALSKIIIAGRSDSASFDNVLEAFVHGGRSLLHAIVHMLPEAWQHHAHLEPDLRAFYEYHACLSEPWDGPAAVSFTDARVIGAIVDRNGLRPARYKITTDYLFVCSEAGCVDFPPESVEENGKLSPGKVIALDLESGVLLKNDDIKSALAKQRPYAEWTKNYIVGLDEILAREGADLCDEPEESGGEDPQTLRRAFGYTQEDLELILKPMGEQGKEPVGSMGDDTPLAAFSRKPRPLYSYFKQLFAQVTNPPIDPLRESLVTSLRMYLGKSGNVFSETPEHARQIRIRSPFLTKPAFDRLVAQPGFPAAVLPALFPADEGPECLNDSLLELCVAAEKAVEAGYCFIVLSDRGVDARRAPIPMLLAVGAVHHHLIRAGKRMNVSLIVETGEAREVHHFACLCGFGASAIYPYLALRTVRELAARSGKISPREAARNFLKACEAGLLKIMSKMGISVLQSYHAAQLFEIAGLKEPVIHSHFTGTPAGLTGAVGIEEIAADTLAWHKAAFSEDAKILDIGGHYRFRREGEYHAFNPDIVKALHTAVAEGDAQAYHRYAELVNGREPMTIRDLLRPKAGKKSADLKNVESSSEIVKRFCTPGISYGAISKEVHEDFALAMNRIGAKSDSGEGGEDPARYDSDSGGDSKNSAIKQVASGRFGVTAHYLSRARELEIKIAQGAKPGEGGQLPGHKVSPDIARIRHSTPGVTLISPPPHHDIYSIEDLSQLIYDLKRANPDAKVCVKLVSEAGIGTIAAGVVKAHADVILISGYDGGTGASPLSSIKHAGLPWELGLAETQQALVRNGLRDRVTLRVDGGLKSGLDVVKAALFGAEEFGFGTAAMVAAGCVMVRQCHLNTCPVGVATQDPALRAKYKGTPERVVNFFHFVAEEVRLVLAGMGFKNLNDIVGRVDLLEPLTNLENPRLGRLNLKKLIAFPYARGVPLRNTVPRNDWSGDDRFDETAIEAARGVLESGRGEVRLSFPVRNTQRSIGARLSHVIVKKHGPAGLPGGRVVLDLRGTAGQSFGAFGAATLQLNLTGEANDYVGKGLSGAVISLRPPEAARFRPQDNVICGNTCLYGATSGQLFVNGRAGERFAVRNSGADAVVEGTGDHGCEYMTGGRVLVLGPVGFNFAAGMTGGEALVFDPDGIFPTRLNRDEVEILPADWDSEGGRGFRELLERHVALTASPLGDKILSTWAETKKKFLRVVPKEILARSRFQENPPEAGRN